jgi:hypothetical protein
MGLQRKLSCRAPCPGATAEVIVCPGHLDLSALNDRMCDIGQSKPGRLAYVGKASRLTSFVVSWLKRFYLAKADRRLRHERRDPGVPTRASCSSGPAMNRRATVICPSGDEEPSQKKRIALLQSEAGTLCLLGRLACFQQPTGFQPAGQPSL